MVGAPLVEIPTSCFESCEFLYTVKLSENTKTIWKRAFAGDKCLVNVNLDYVEYLKDNCFEGCKNLTTINMPSIIDIRHEAFYECNKITSVTLGDKVERIYVRAFFQLPIGEFVIGNAEDFGYYYFEYAGPTDKYGNPTSGIFHNYLPTSVVASIDKTNPADWATLITGHYNKGIFICTQKWMDDNDYKNNDRVPYYQLMEQDYTASEGKGPNGNGESLVVKDGISYSLDFKTNTYKVTAVETESSVVTILGTIDGKLVTTIGEGAFSGNQTLQQVIFPDSIKEIENEAFSSCANLYEVDMSKASLTKIPEGCFENCSSLYEVKLPKTIKSICERAFAGNENLAEIDLANVQEFRASCFENCKAITEITLTNAMDIRNRAFEGCTNLVKVVVGNKVERIYQNAFSSLPITYFEIGNGMELTWGYYANGTSKGTLKSQLPLNVFGDETEQETFDPNNPSSWATIMTHNYNQDNFICSQKWVDERGYTNGQTFVYDFFITEA